MHNSNVTFDTEPTCENGAGFDSDLITCGFSLVHICWGK